MARSKPQSSDTASPSLSQQPSPLVLKPQEIIWAHQIEMTRLHQAALSNQQSVPGDRRRFANLSAYIIRLWQIDAGARVNPTRHPIELGSGESVILPQVLNLVPRKYQEDIWLENDEQFGPNRSWLSEGLMNLLVFLIPNHASSSDISSEPSTSNSSNSAHSKIVFGPDLANDITHNSDRLYRRVFKTASSFLDHQIAQMEQGAPRGEWAPKNRYTFDRSTRRICFFWNYTEDHWTVLVMDLHDGTYTLYNSICSGKNGEAHEQAVKQMVKLERLVRSESGFPPALTKSVLADVRIGNCPQQRDFDDCGVHAVTNIWCLLAGRDPSVWDGGNIDRYRWTYMSWVARALVKRLRERGMEVPEWEKIILEEGGEETEAVSVKESEEESRETFEEVDSDSDDEVEDDDRPFLGYTKEQSRHLSNLMKEEDETEDLDDDDKVLLSHEETDKNQTSPTSDLETKDENQDQDEDEDEKERLGLITDDKDSGEDQKFVDENQDEKPEIIDLTTSSPSPSPSLPLDSETNASGSDSDSNINSGIMEVSPPSSAPSSKSEAEAEDKRKSDMDIFSYLSHPQSDYSSEASRSGLTQEQIQETVALALGKRRRQEEPDPKNDGHLTKRAKYGDIDTKLDSETIQLDDS